MKTKAMIVLAVFCCFLVFGVTPASSAITDVVISPDEPTIFDPISIITSGKETAGPVSIKNSEFQIDGTSIDLDIFFVVGHSTVMTPWSHTEDFAFLTTGTYDLTVSTFDDGWQPPFRRRRKRWMVSTPANRNYFTSPTNPNVIAKRVACFCLA